MPLRRLEYLRLTNTPLRLCYIRHRTKAQGEPRQILLFQEGVGTPFETTWTKLQSEDSEPALGVEEVSFTARVMLYEHLSISEVPCYTSRSAEN